MTGALHAHIHYQAGYEPNNWHYTVDYVTPGNPKGDFSIDSLDYGNVASFEEALACVNWVYENAYKLDQEGAQRLRAC